MLAGCIGVAKRLERNIKDVLDQIGDDKQRLQQLLTGKRVLLAEELSKSTVAWSLEWGEGGVVAGLAWRQPHHRSGLATLHSVGAVP